MSSIKYELFRTILVPLSNLNLCAFQNEMPCKRTHQKLTVIEYLLLINLHLLKEGTLQSIGTSKSKEYTFCENPSCPLLSLFLAILSTAINFLLCGCSEVTSVC